MEYEIRPEGDALVLELNEERLDYETAAEFDGVIEDLVKQGRTRLVVNLHTVGFVDSSGLGSLVRAHRRVGSQGCLAYCCVNEFPLNLLRMTRVDRILQVFRDEGEALNAKAA